MERSFIENFSLQGWKTEHVIMEDPFTSDRVILVEPGDPKQYWNKVGDILAYVDRDLGLVDTKLSDYENKKVTMYVSCYRYRFVLTLFVFRCTYM